MALTNKEEPSREDWKAKEAESTQLAIPKPPKRVGREKCNLLLRYSTSKQYWIKDRINSMLKIGKQRSTLRNNPLNMILLKLQRPGHGSELCLRLNYNNFRKLLNAAAPHLNFVRDKISCQ